VSKEHLSKFKIENWDFWLNFYGGHNLNSFKLLIGQYIQFRSKRSGKIILSTLRDVTIQHGFDEKVFLSYIGRCKKFFDKSLLRLGEVKTQTSASKLNKLSKSRTDISLSPTNPSTQSEELTKTKKQSPHKPIIKNQIAIETLIGKLKLNFEESQDRQHCLREFFTAMKDCEYSLNDLTYSDSENIKTFFVPKLKPKRITKEKYEYWKKMVEQDIETTQAEIFASDLKVKIKPRDLDSEERRNFDLYLSNFREAKFSEEELSKDLGEINDN